MLQLNEEAREYKKRADEEVSQDAAVFNVEDGPTE